MRSDPESFRFDEGSRELQVQPHRRATCALRFGSWNDGLPLSRLDGATWVPEAADPQLRLVLDSHSSGDDSPRSRFSGDLPADARRIVAPFLRHQLTLLRMLRWCEGGASFIEGAPVLAWLLAGHLAKRFDATVASALLRRRRVAILSEIVGAPTSAAALRLVSRYTPDHWSEHSEQILLRVLRDPKLVAWCGHERDVEPRLLFSLVRYRSLIAGRFLRPLLRGRHADAPELKAVAAAARAALDLGTWLGRPDAARVVMACPTTERLVALLDRWTVEHQKRGDELTRSQILKHGTDWTFDEPPLLGTETIVPIRSPLELVDEGIDLHHCAARLVIDVFAGSVYMYKVLAPERATVSIRVHSGAGRIEELYGLRNSRVAPATLAAVEAWLRTEKVLPPSIQPGSRGEIEDTGSDVTCGPAGVF